MASSAMHVLLAMDKAALPFTRSLNDVPLALEVS